MNTPINRSGPDVILLHGWGGNTQSTWDANGWADELGSTGRRVHGIDLLGHGNSPAPTDPEDYADLAAPVLDYLAGLTHTVDVIGFSLGAKVSLDVARRAPSAVRRLVMLGAGDNVFGHEQVDLLVAALREPANQDFPPLVRGVADAAIVSGNSTEALIACLRRPSNPVFTPSDLARVTADVLLIAGEFDTAYKGHQHLAANLPHSQAVVVDGVDHNGTPASRQVRRRALAFLNSPSIADLETGTL